jgi:ABC-2 type transport system ATP-binding protein
MKCELAASLIHRPQVLFLDEPTIGLDVSMQVVIRDFIKAYNERTGATLILTSHYMDDVAALCPRVVVIDRGPAQLRRRAGRAGRRIRPEKRLCSGSTGPGRSRHARGRGPRGLHRRGRRRSPGRPGRGERRGLPALATLRCTTSRCENAPLEEVMSELFARAVPPGASGGRGMSLRSTVAPCPRSSASASPRWSPTAPRCWSGSLPPPCR